MYQADGCACHGTVRPNSANEGISRWETARERGDAREMRRARESQITEKPIDGYRLPIDSLRTRAPSRSIYSPEFRG